MLSTIVYLQHEVQTVQFAESFEDSESGTNPDVPLPRKSSKT